MQKHIAMLVLLLWMGVLCSYGQADSMAARSIATDEIQENYVVMEMDSITTKRVEDQILLQQFVESIPAINASCPMTLYGNLTMDSLSFRNPQVCYHVSTDSKDYTQSKEDGALMILLSRTSHFLKSSGNAIWASPIWYHSRIRQGKQRLFILQMRFQTSLHKMFPENVS